MERRRTGRWLGLPYDWRAPTRSRVRERMWNPEDSRLLTPKTFGWGFDLNLYLAGASAALVSLPPLIECRRRGP